MIKEFWGDAVVFIARHPGISVYTKNLFYYLPFFFQENKAWHFMWIVCLAIKCQDLFSQENSQGSKTGFLEEIKMKFQYINLLLFF